MSEELIKNDLEENIKNNKSLKKQLKEVSLKIEEVISDYKKRKEYSIPVNNDNIKKIDLKKFNEFVSQIEEQKNKVESYKEMIEYDNKYSNITKDEDELKYIKQQLLDLKKEHEFLLKMNKKQEQGMKDVLNTDFTSNQIMELNQKLKNLKEEYRKMNDTFKSLNLKLKNQTTEINSLSENCQLIKTNIELRKKQKLNPEINDLISDNNNTYQMIINLKKEIKEKNIIAKNQEESYKNEINMQEKIKKNLQNEIKKIENKLLNHYYEKKLNELKIKEITKIKNEINKNKEKEKKDLKLQKLKQQKETIKQLNIKKFYKLKEKENSSDKKLNFDLKKNYSYIFEEEKRKIKIPSRSYKKLNLNIGKFNPNSNSSINIFNINKSKKNEQKMKEKEEFMKKIGVQLEEHEKQRGKMIQEIEFLKDDIEKVLNKNEIIDKNVDDIKKEKNGGNNDNMNNINNNLMNEDNIIGDKDAKKTINRNPFDFAFSNK